MGTDITGFFFNQGILGVIILVLASALIYMFRQYQEVQSKRLQDLIDFRSTSLATVNTLITAVESLQKSVDSMSDILNSINWREKK